MDPNANAAGVVPEAAPQGPATQTPTAEASPVGAETGTTVAPQSNGIELDEATQKYLSNQNIVGSPNEVIAELVKRNQSLRNQPKVEEVAEVLKQTEQPQPTQPVQQAPAPAPAPSHSLSDMEIMTTQMLVEKNYPDVKVDSNFYKQMIADGINPMQGGEINLNRVMKYAERQQKLIQAEKILAQQPAPIPSPTNDVQTTGAVTPVAQMNKLAAENIILFSNREKRYGRAPHPQYDEAVKFLQSNR